KAHLRYAGTDTTLPVSAYGILRKVKDSIVIASARPHPDGQGFSISESDLARPNPDGSPTTEPLVQEQSVQAMKAEFEKAHKAGFGFVDESKEIVVEAISVEAIAYGSRPRPSHTLPTAAALPLPDRRTRFFSRGGWHEAAVYIRSRLRPGHKVSG